jgi:copper chaperone CopZ
MANPKSTHGGNSFILLALLGVAAAGGVTLSHVSAASEQPAAAAESPSGTAIIEIPDVGCANCSPGVRKALRSAGGVRDLEEGTPRTRIVVTYDPAPGRPAAYVDALKSAGYTGARLAKAD